MKVKQTSSADIKNNRKSFYIKAGAAVILLALGFVIGQLFMFYNFTICANQYKFINTNEVCGRKKVDVLAKTNYTETQANIEKFIADQKTNGRLSEAAVYFRDLENGPIFGINEDMDFAPASLLKLPLALVYLTQAERDPEILKEKLSVAEPQWSFTPYFTSGPEIDPTVPHSTESLLESMLEDSDNNAYGVLQTHFYEIGKEDLITRTFLELGFVNPTNVNDEVMSVREYSSIFRVLYDVSYLNVELSAKVLNWLGKATFTQGLVAGVPPKVPVAHKFGERFTPDGKKQLHDCGIVYFPKNPYLLCVMTRGTNFDDLAFVIKHISAEVYAEVNARQI